MVGIRQKSQLGLLIWSLEACGWHREGISGGFVSITQGLEASLGSFRTGDPGPARGGAWEERKMGRKWDTELFFLCPRN